MISVARPWATPRSAEDSTISPRTLLIAWDAVVLAAVSLYLAQSSSLDPESALFPRLIGYPVAALTLASLAIQTLPPLAWLRDAEGAIERIVLPRLGVAIVLTAAFILLWDPLGFQLDTVVFLLVAPALLGFRRPAIMGATAIGTALLFVFLFHLGAGAILPAGVFHLRYP